MHRKKSTTPLDEIRMSWTDEMIRRRVNLDRLAIDDYDRKPDYQYPRMVMIDLYRRRVQDLESILIERQSMPDFDRMLEIFDQFRPQSL